MVNGHRIASCIIVYDAIFLASSTCAKKFLARYMRWRWRNDVIKALLHRHPTIAFAPSRLHHRTIAIVIALSLYQPKHQWCDDATLNYVALSEILTFDKYWPGRVIFFKISPKYSPLQNEYILNSQSIISKPLELALSIILIDRLFRQRHWGSESDAQILQTSCHMYI